MIKKIIIGNFVYNGVNTLFTLVIGIVLSIIIARLLGPSDYGVYNLVVWMLGVVGLISLMGFPTTVEKYVSEYDGRQDRNTLKKIIGFILKIELFWGLIVAIFLVASANKLSLLMKHPEFRIFFWIAALIVIPSGVNSIFASITRGLQIFKNIMVANIITLSLSLGLILLVLNRGAGVIGILWVILGANLINILIFFLLLRNVLSLRGGLNLPRPIKKKILNFNLTLLAIMASELIIRQKSEVFFLNLFRTTEEAGYYGLAFGIAIISVRFLPESFARVIGPALSNRYGAQDMEGLNRIFTKSTKYLIMMTVPICTGIVIIAKPFIELVYGKNYLPSAGILPILAISSSLGIIVSVASWLIYATEKQNINLIIGIAAAAFNLTIAVLLIPQYGIYGATIANSVAQGAGFILGFTWVHIKMKFRFPLFSFCKTCFAGMVAGWVMYFFMTIWSKSLLSLVNILILGGGSYISIIFLTQKADIDGLKSYLLDLGRKKF